jgi:hypothetical protein
MQFQPSTTVHFCAIGLKKLKKCPQKYLKIVSTDFIFSQKTTKNLADNHNFQDTIQLWQYRLGSFQGRDTKLESFWAKNQL